MVWCLSTLRSIPGTKKNERKEGTNERMNLDSNRGDKEHQIVFLCMCMCDTYKYCEIYKVL